MSFHPNVYSLYHHPALTHTHSQIRIIGSSFSGRLTFALGSIPSMEGGKFSLDMKDGIIFGYEGWNYLWIWRMKSSLDMKDGIFFGYMKDWTLFGCMKDGILLGYERWNYLWIWRKDFSLDMKGGIFFGYMRIEFSLDIRRMKFYLDMKDGNLWIWRMEFSLDMKDGILFGYKGWNSLWIWRMNLSLDMKYGILLGYEG